MRGDREGQDKLLALHQPLTARHRRAHRTLMSQGRYAEAGRELEGLEKLLEQR